LTRSFQVTAAQNKEVAALLTLANTLRLHVAAITPDAGALVNLLLLLRPPFHCAVWRDDRHWLWATRHQWGRKPLTEAAAVGDLAALLALKPEDMALFAADNLDPFTLVSRNLPPLPECGADFTVALALAMGDIVE